MHEIDFLPVGDAGKSGDAICARFTRPDTETQAVVVIDAGYADDGEALVEHIKQYYGTDVVDLAILTHPDGDHIGGMGEVIRGLTVKQLWLHDIGARGGASLRAAIAVDDLMGVAKAQGTEVHEAWAGASEFGGAITILGPTEAYYERLVKEQVDEKSTVAKAGSVLLEAARSLADRLAAALGVENPFDAKDVNPRNNSSMIILAKFGEHTQLFTADAGVPALEAAWDYADAVGLAAKPTMVQIPHHGSRRNCSSAWLDRLLGPTGQTGVRTAIVSCVAQSDKHPSGKVVNAHMRRGCNVIATAGKTICNCDGSGSRQGWVPVAPLSPMLEEDD
jgi:beta-lactamase superfamily II metal-dependent hydrolase